MIESIHREGKYYFDIPFAYELIQKPTNHA